MSMSRGLGKLQRIIKGLVEAQSKAFDKVCAASDDGPPNDGPSFWLTWSEIRFRLFKDGMYYYDDPSWLTHERAAKRALYTLWKRGEIGRIRDGGMYWYMTAETYDESFSPEALAKLKGHLERMADAATLQE
jgi:hypothetical protein